MDGLDAIATLLRQRIGLEPASLEGRALADAVRVRMKACRLLRESDYAGRVLSHADEFQELVEEMVVPESWFFRDVQPFECLRWFVRRRPPGRPLRVLSLPCGGGEETYSLAMTLLDCGLPREKIVVEGIDVSRRALRRAEEAYYSARSFRETDAVAAGLCRRFLRAEGDGFRVGDELRSLVRFRHGNLAASDFLSERQATEDIIFCRNVLIYFTEDARRISLGHLARLLDAEGMLYVGHAEARATLDSRFRLLSPEYPFALGPARCEPLPELRIERPSVPASGGRELASGGREPPESVLSGGSRPPLAVDPLTLAQQHADAGQLDEAAHLCEQLLQSRPPPVSALYLLGVIRQAQGQLAEASRCYHQVLYLEPAHHETLIHLALLAERDGHREQAARYRRRAERAGRSEADAP